MANKMLYGIRNVVCSVITESEGSDTYGTPFAMKWAKSISLSPLGDETKIYADDVVALSITSNQGYEGDLVLLTIDDNFKKEVLGYETDDNGALIENANATFKRFALGFEFQGDDKAKRTWMYNCSCTRPNIESQTKEQAINEQNETLSITASPRVSDGITKVSLIAGSTGYDAFLSEVYEPVHSV